MTPLVSSCCGSELTWGFEQHMTSTPIPLGYSAFCKTCRKWCVSIPVADADGVKMDMRPLDQTAPIPQYRWVAKGFGSGGHPPSLD
jgi:hypothetical protein